MLDRVGAVMAGVRDCASRRTPGTTWMPSLLLLAAHTPLPSTAAKPWVAVRPVTPEEGMAEFWTTDGGGRRLDPEGLSGTVRVEFDVPDARSAVLMLDGVQVSDCSPVRKGGGRSRFACRFDTDAVDAECTGWQLQPRHKNGEYELSISAEMHDGSHSNATQVRVAINNSARLLFAIEGTSVLQSGVRFYGGPETISVSACPVSYVGTQVRQLTFSSKCINTTAQPRIEKVACPRLHLGTMSGNAALSSISLLGPPFIMTVRSTENGVVSNIMDDAYVIMGNGVVDDRGRTVTSEFPTAHLQSETLRFDFVPPSLVDATLLIGDEPVAAGRSYSADSNNRFRLHGMTDLGVGVDDGGVSVDIGDCLVNVAEVDGEPVDRRTKEFEPLYRDVTWIGQLPEEDAELNSFLDRGGAECYVAILAGLVDRLGNSWDDWQTPEDQLQTAEFGVDKTPPLLNNVRLDRPGPFTNTADIVFRFNAIDPKLGSGDDGAGVLPSGGGVWVVPLGRVGPVSVDTASGSGRGRVNVLPGDGRYTLAVRVVDAAIPPNESVESVEVMYDGTPPVFRDLAGTTGQLHSRDYVDVWLAGSVSDDVSGLRRVVVSVRLDRDDGECSSTDPFLRSGGGPRVVIDGGGVATINMSDSLRIYGPPEAGNIVENICIIALARNMLQSVSEGEVAYFQVHWRRR